MALNTPKNGWAKALWILHQSYISGVSMTKVLTYYEPTFWKFQSRLSELIIEYPKLNVEKKIIPFTSKITGKKGYTTQYRPLCPPNYLLNLYNAVNEKGFKGRTNKKTEQ